MKKVEPSTETGCGSETSAVSSSAWWFKLKWKGPGLIFISALKPFCFFLPPSCLLPPLSFTSCWILHARTHAHTHWKHRDLQGSWRGSSHRVAVNVTVFFCFFCFKFWSLSLEGFADLLDQLELRAACAPAVQLLLSQTGDSAEDLCPAGESFTRAKGSVGSLVSTLLVKVSHFSPHEKWLMAFSGAGQRKCEACSL